VQLGPDWINIHGSADLTISFLDDNGRAFGGDLDMVLDIDGSLSVGVTAFFVDIGDLTLGVSYNSGSGAILVSVPYPEPYIAWACFDAGFFDICVPYPSVRTSHFSISVGTLTAEAEPPPPPVLGQVDGNGVLTLNVGANAAARKLLVEEINENVTIARLGAGSVRGSAIQVSMFGHAQTFDNVTDIQVGDMGSGDDVVEIASSVTTRVVARLGDGNDTLRNLGSGVLIAHGDAGNDRLDGGSNDDQLFGEAGEDVIDGRAGSDRIDGGDHSDRLIGGAGADTITGGGGGDLIAGDLAVISGDAVNAVFETSASATGGSDDIHGGDGTDIIFGGSGDDDIAGDAGVDGVYGDDGKVTLQAENLLITLLDLGLHGNDRLTWAVGEGGDVVDGQRGNDRLDISGTPGSEQVTIGASGAGFSAAVGAETLAVEGIETANVEGRQGGDAFTVNDLGASGLVQLDLELGADSASDTVTVNGSSGADVFTIAPSGNVLRVQKAGGATIDVSDAGPASGGDAITLDSGDGADVVNVLGTRAGTFTTVKGGAHDDTINVGSSGGTLDGIAGLLTINGNEPGASDVLNVDDSGDTGANSGALTATSITGLGMAGSIVYGTIETLNIELGSGADAFTVESTHAGATNLHANGGDDTINVGVGSLNGLSGPLAVSGGDGADTLNVDDTGDTEPNTGALTAITITGLGMGVGIAYGAVETLNIDLSSGADTFTIDSTHDGATNLRANAGDDTANVRAISGDTTVDGGEHDDTINVGSFAPAGGGMLEGIAALLTIEGNEPASGSDVLNIDDSGDTGANSGALTGTRITGLGMAGSVIYGTVETLNIDLGSGGDTFTIESTHAGTTDLHANGGDDTINVGLGSLNGLSGPLAASGGDGTDTLNVDDTGDTEPNVGELPANTITGLGMGEGIDYLDFETLVVSLGSGGNRFDITGTAATTTVVNTGAGDDVVRVSLDAATDGPLTVNLQEGNDVLDASGSSLGLTISGGDGRDVIAGGSGGDAIHGGGDDDELSGALGSDALYGDDGNDLLLGDTGTVSGGNVLLTEVVTQIGWIALNGPQAPGAEQAALDALFDADLVLLAGRYLADGSKALHADGSWDSRALLLDLVADGDDSLYGGEGDDALFGQRGNDLLSGDNGDDLLSGGAGDDELAGGEGNDSLVGDDLHLDSAAAALPNVAHGLRLGDTTLVPMVSVEPGRDTNAFSSVLARLFGDAPDDSLALGDGSVLAPLAAVVTGFAHHLGQLRGNDALRGEGGDDTLVGDDQMTYAGALAFDTERMARAEAFTRSLLDVSDDFSDLVHRQYALLDDYHEHYDRHSTLVDNVYTVGADTLDGGEGHDVLIGDDNLFLEPSFTLPVGLAGDFERFAEGVEDAGHELVHAVLDLEDLDRHQREEVVQVQVPDKRHFDEVLVHHVDIVLMGNDILLGGSGNDQIVGDSFIVRTADMTLLAGGTAGCFGKDDAWQDDDWKDDRHDDGERGYSSVQSGADTISGGDGADLIWGDNLALVSSTLTRGPALGWTDFDRAQDEARDGLEAIAQLTDAAAHWLAPGFDNGDDVSGGEGDDIIFGQAGDDALRGDAGDDWLVGGEGKDALDGGPGEDRLKYGSDSSSGLERAVAARMIDWSGSFGKYGLTYAPFGGLGLANGGGHSNYSSFKLLSFERSRHGYDD
jgi:Ca2+-binding RTX toxin-like protein